jgi:acetylglutamate kinase
VTLKTEPRERVVLKLGGTTLTEQRATLSELAVVDSQTGQPQVVVVHGGGKRLTDWLGRLGVETRFQDGLRVTSDDAMEVVSAVLRGVVNTELVAQLRSEGASAVGISGIDGGLVLANPMPGLGRSATPARVQPQVLETLLAAGYLPVVAPVCLDTQGRPCNVNADDVAAALASALRARLVLLTDTDGVRGADGNRIASMTSVEAEALIAEGTVAGGMVPKVRAALASLQGGATEAVIADGGAQGALSRALYDPESGTRLRA